MKIGILARLVSVVLLAIMLVITSIMPVNAMVVEKAKVTKINMINANAVDRPMIQTVQRTARDGLWVIAELPIINYGMALQVRYIRHDRNAVTEIATATRPPRGLTNILGPKRALGWANNTGGNHVGGKQRTRSSEAGR